MLTLHTITGPLSETAEQLAGRHDWITAVDVRVIFMAASRNSTEEWMTHQEG
jgi:hypothetical protein